MWWWCCIFSSSYTVLMQSSVSTIQREHGERRVNKMVSFKWLGKTSMTFQHVLNILHIRKVVTQALYCIAIILKPSQHCHTKNYGTKYILRIYVFYIQYIFKSMFLVFSHQYNILFYSVTFVKMTLYITWHAVWNISYFISWWAGFHNWIQLPCRKYI